MENPYAVTAKDVIEARDNLDKLRHLEFCVEQWATQSGQDATLAIRKMLNAEISAVLGE